MKYRIPTSVDTAALVKIHTRAFNDFFLTELGPSFLKTYYKAAIQDTASIAVCVVNDENEVIGFATGCKQANGYNRKLVLKNIPAFLLQAIRLLFTRPGAVYRLLKNFEKKSNPADDGNYAELFSIAVLPAYNGLGIGKKLLEKFEQEALQKGCSKITLTTDFHNNDKVVEFYKKCGYNLFYDFYTYPQRRMYKMIKELN